MTSSFFSVLAAFALLVAGCASGGKPHLTSGYGERPLTPEATITRTVSSRDVLVIGKPDPFYLHTQGNWQYGWRVCADIDKGKRQGFFLLRGDSIIHRALTATDKSAAGTPEVLQYCPSLTDLGTSSSPSLNATRIDVKN